MGIQMPNKNFSNNIILQFEVIVQNLKLLFFIHLFLNFTVIKNTFISTNYPVNFDVTECGTVQLR